MLGDSMKKALMIVGVGALVLVGAFYGLNWFIYDQKQGGQATQQATTTEPELTPATTTLLTKIWTWESTLINDGREIKPRQAGKFTLTFRDDGTFGASTDCNSMGGTYSLGATGTIAFSDIAQTLMACENSQEAVFSGFLTNTSGYHFTSRGELVLDLKFDSGSVVFR